VRAQLEAAPVAWGTTSIAITVSIGASAFLRQDGRAEAALERADEALYRAKAAGRNRVEVADTARPLDHEPLGALRLPERLI
jgi:diguanylate cyclase (GGDEF)-like protein